jgi:hypothetical protein
MDFISPWMYYLLLALVSIALLSIAYMRHDYIVKRRSFARVFLMLGWASIAFRFWLGALGGDMTITYSGAVGILLLAIGTVLAAMER